MAFTCITQLHEYAWQAHFHMHSNSTSTSSRRDSQMKRIIKLLENSNSECEELLGGHEIKISLGLKTCHDRDITRFYEQKSRKNTHTHSHSLTCRWMMIMWNRTFKFHANKNKRAAVSLSRSATLRSYVFSHPSYLYRKRAWPILIGTFTIRSGCRSSRFFHCQISTFSSSCEVCDNCRLSFFFHWLTRAHTLAHLFSAGGWTFSIQEI